MQLKEMILDENGMELTAKGEPLFPVTVYYNDIFKFPTSDVPWHWHEEVEIALSMRGGFVAELGDRTITVAEGEGLFLNSNTLHSMRPLAQTGCEMLNALFDAAIVSGEPHSLLSQKFVLPLVRCTALDALPLNADVSWQSKILHLLADIYRTQENMGFGYELKIKNCISEIWFELVTNEREMLSQSKDRADDGRIKQMLKYIHNNYASPIQLEDIAVSASVSVRECCRCFKSRLGVSPFAYLLNYRVRMAAELLAATDKPVTEVGLITGFNSASYFGKVFKKLTGFTPCGYRKSVK